MTGVERFRNMNKTLGALAIASLACLATIPAGAAQRDGAIIQNSGSTNFSGYTIKVWSDGSAWTVPSRRGVASGSPRTGTVPMQLVSKFFEDLKTAKQSGHVAAQTCMKSASFGSTMVVQYHGWTTPDLTCPGDGFVVSIAADANKIAAALSVQTSRRTPMLPNEHRRPPVEGTPAPQASASPEQHAPTA